MAQWLEHWISNPAVRVRIPSGTWDENPCLVNFKSCKSVEITGCILLHITFYNEILENVGVHTNLVISPLLLILHH